MGRLLLVGLFASLLPGCAGCDPDIVDPTAGRLVVEPLSLTFNLATVGERAEQTIRLDNVGTAPLTTTPSLVSNDFRVLPDRGIELAPGESLELTVRFAPTVAAELAATLQFSNTTPPVTVALAGRGTALPLCDDGNECTDDTYQVSLASCEYAFHDRSCQPNNACVQDPSCADGACLGTFIECPAPSATCRESYCDSEIGCTQRDIPGACDDDDPCTDDVCTDAGCLHPPAEDGTGCGEYVQCESVAICQAGQCNVIPVPDGAPCEDGNVCTADSCEAGVCVGVSSGPGEPAVNQMRTHVVTSAHAATALGDGRVAIVQDRSATEEDAGGSDLVVLENTSLTSSPQWSIDAVQQLDTAYIDVVGLDDGRLVAATSAGLAVYAPEEDGLLAQTHPVTAAAPVGTDISSLIMAQGEYVFGCAFTPNIPAPFVARVPLDGPPVNVNAPQASWPCGSVFVALRALPHHRLITTYAPSTILYWDVSDPANVMSEAHSFQLADGPSAPLGWETTEVTGIFDPGLNGDGRIWLFDFNTLALSELSFSFPDGVSDARGVGDTLYVLSGDVVYAANNPGAQTSFSIVATGLSRLELLGRDLIAQRDGSGWRINGLYSLAGLVDGRIGAVGSPQAWDGLLALQNQRRFSTVNVDALTLTASAHWQGQPPPFQPRLAIGPATAVPRLSLHDRYGPVVSTSFGQLWTYDQTAAQTGAAFGPHELVNPIPEGLSLAVGTTIPLGQHLYSIGVFSDGAGLHEGHLRRLDADPTLATWSPVSSQQFVAAQFDFLSFMHIGTGPDRLAIALEGDDGSLVLSLLDLTEPDASSVIGGPIFAPPGTPFATDHSLAAAGPTVVHVYRQDFGYTLHRITFVPGSPTSGYETVFSEGPFPDTSLRVLAVADPFIILGGEDRVIYLDLDTLSVQYDIPVVGHPQKTVGFNDKLYVTTEQSVAEIFPPCP